MGSYRSLNHKIQTALTFSREDWGILLKAWGWLLYVDLLLRSRPFPRVQQVVSSRQESGRQIAQGQEWDIIHRHRRFVILAARHHLYWMGCLRQALALKALLGGQGISTELRFGVQKEAGKLLAHAWLEYRGQSVELTNMDEAFTPLTAMEKGQ
jgi:hypothetical protein